MSVNEIALQVEEPVPGQFYWVLLQSPQPGQAEGTVLDRASAPLPSYGIAYLAGSTALALREYQPPPFAWPYRFEQTDFGEPTQPGRL